MALLDHIPYILLITANLIYLCVHGFKPLRYHPKLFLYNFLLFLLVGVVIFFKASYHLYRWFKKGDGDVRQKTKIKIQELLKFAEMISNYFLPENLHNLVNVMILLWKLYTVLASWTLLSYLIPRLLLGFVYGLVFELKSFANDNYPEAISILWQRIYALIGRIEERVPRYNTGAERTNDI
jgi:hypothetical protein